MAYIDEVVEKNKRYLTQAQVEALSAASRQYNTLNAAGRASALASAREQYDAGYRGLQNMGLAGSVSGPATSGEVPRLKAQVSAPFEDYNRRLRDVENQRINALGGQMAQQTKAEEEARAAEAEQQRQAALRQAQLSAAAVVSKIQTMKNDKSSVARVINNNRPSGAKGITSEDLNTIKRYDEPYTEPEKPATRAQTVQNTLAEGVNQAFMANAQVIAAAKVLGISSPANKAVNKVKQSLSPILNQKTGVAHTDDERQAANQILQATKDMNKGYDKAEAKQQFEAAQKKVDAMDEAMSTGAWDVPDDVYRQAVAQRDVAKLKAEDPNTYAMLVTVNSDLDAATKKKAVQGFVDKEFAIDEKDAAQKYNAASQSYSRMMNEWQNSQKKEEQENKEKNRQDVGDVLQEYKEAEESGNAGAMYRARKKLSNLGFNFETAVDDANKWYWLGDQEEFKPDKDTYNNYKYYLDVLGDKNSRPQDVQDVKHNMDVLDITENDVREYVARYESDMASSQPQQVPEKIQQAYDDMVMAELRYKEPETYKAFQILQFKDIIGKYDPEAVEKASDLVADQLMKQQGFKAPSMTGEEYTAAKKDIKGVKDTLRKIENAQYAYDNAGEAETEDIVSDKEHAKNELDATVRELKDKYGMTTEEAYAWVEKFETERDARSEYNYFKPGMLAQVENQGLTPEQPVNQKETNPIYRDINGLPVAAPGLEEVLTNTMGEYMTKEQKDMYNAIYERDGIDAANQFYNDIIPYLNIQRAQQDEEFNRRFTEEHPIIANLHSVGQNMIWNIPAMAENIAKGIQGRFTEERPYYDVNSDWSYRSQRADIIRSTTSENILNNMSRPEWVNNLLNFTYQTGMSMADSAAVLPFAYVGADWAVYALFGSSAGMSAYKDAISRGATQDQALTLGILNGVAEGFFEDISLESLLKADFMGKGALVKNLTSQGVVEGSEELATGLANFFSDLYVMRDKSEYNAAVDKYISQGMNKNVAEYKALLDQASEIGLEGLGGALSGLLFAAGSAGVNARSYKKTGKQLRSDNAKMEQYTRLANLLGGKPQELLEQYNADQIDTNAGKFAASVNESLQDLFGKKAAPDVSKDTALEENAGSGKQVDLDAAVKEKIVDRATAGAALLSGDRMNASVAESVIDIMGREYLSDMGLDARTPESLAKSYNARLSKYGIVSQADMTTWRMQNAQKNGNLPQFGNTVSAMRNETAQAYNQRADFMRNYNAGMTRGGTRTVGMIGTAAQEQQTRQQTIEKKKAKAEYKEEAANRVWKDPNLGYAVTDDGQIVKGMPGNMTAVPYEQQQKSNFAARTTAKTGNVTYQVAGMEAREGLTDAQKVEEIKKQLTPEARKRAEFFEKFAKSLPGMKLVLKDDMNGANARFDPKTGALIFSLSSKQSVTRVMSHELTHSIKDFDQKHGTHYFDELQKAIVDEIGEKRFNAYVEQKAEEYTKQGVPIDLNTEEGRALAEEETVAEMCERMLSNPDWVEKFVEEHQEAAKTIRDLLLKIVNAIRTALKDMGNVYMGQSWSNEIKQTENMLTAWYTGIDAVLKSMSEREAVMETEADTDELYRSVDDIRAEEAKKAAEASAKKKTYVPGFKAAEVERVLEAGVFGDKSNYEGDDYEQARAMIAQLIPDMVSLLKKEGDIDAVVEKTKAAVGKMLDNYFEDDGDMAALREAIPSVIGVDSTAKSDLKAQDQSLFQMSAKLSKALGHPVTLVSEQNAKGQKNAKYSSAEKLEEVWERVRDQFGLSDDQDFSIDTTKLLDFIEQQADTRKTFNDLYGKQRQEIIASTAVDILQAVKDMYSEKTGQKFSLDTDAYREKITNDTIESIRKIGKKSINDFDSDDIKAAAPFAVQYNKTFPVKEKSPFFRAWFGEWRANSVDQIGVADMPEYVPTNESRKKNRGTYKNTDTGWDISVSREGETNTISHSNEGKKSEYGLAGIKQLVEKAILFESEVHEHHQNNAKNDMIAFDHKLYALGQDAAGIALYRITVEEYFQDYKHPDKKRFHNLKYIEKVADFPGRRTSGGNRSGGSTNWSSSTTVYTVADLYSFVNKYDKEFTPGRKVNPAFLNEDGTPKVFYHGTSETFDAFDRTKGRANMDIQGMFFSPYEIEAGGYGENVGQYYLSIRKPASEGLAYKALNMFKGQNNAGVKAREYLEKLGYDGVVGYDEVIAFEPTQIKSATDNIGTFNKYDERYRFSIDTDYLRLAEKYKSGTATEAETQQLQEAVEQAAKDAGYSDKMYHGSRKGGGFTVFKGWQYFTPNEAYAKRYAQRDNQNSMYQVYVKADNYFDTRKADAKRLFEKYRQEYGLGELQENGLPDWTDGYDLAEIIEDNGLNYDGIILDEGGDLQDGKPVSRGLSYVIRDSAQIKSADPVTYDDQGNIIPLSERFNPEKKDIRWSLDTDAAREARQAFTVIDDTAVREGLGSLLDVKHKGFFALKDISRFMDAIAPTQTFSAEELAARKQRHKDSLSMLNDRLKEIKKEMSEKKETDAKEYRELQEKAENLLVKIAQQRAELDKANTAQARLEKYQKDLAAWEKAKKRGEDPGERPVDPRKELRNTLHEMFEAPHAQAMRNYASGVERMRQRVLDIGAKAGVCDSKGRHFDSKKSAAIQNIGEGFSNTYTNLYVSGGPNGLIVQATDPKTNNPLFKKEYGSAESMREDFGREVAVGVFAMASDHTEDGIMAPFDATVNTRPYTMQDLAADFPNDWAKLKTAADEFRQMYEEYFINVNNMLRMIYPIASEYESVEKLGEAISRKEDRQNKQKWEVERRIAKLEERIEARKKATENQVESLRESLTSIEKEMAKKRKTDTKLFRTLQDRAFAKELEIKNAEADFKEYETVATATINSIRADLAEYEKNVEEEIRKMQNERTEMEKAIEKGDSLSRMHRLEYRKDYFHHFREMMSDYSRLNSIITGETYISAAVEGNDTKETVAVRAKYDDVYNEKETGDISPKIAGRSRNTKTKSRWAGHHQQRGMGADYTADAVKGMLQYGALSEYKLAFDPLVAYLRDTNKAIRDIDDGTNRDGLIRYVDQWADTIAGKSHILDRAVSDAGFAGRKAMQILNWINSRVIQNTLLFNMRSSLVQISNVTNAMGIAKNPADWVKGLWCWASARKDTEMGKQMRAEMDRSVFLANRYMSDLQISDSVIKSAKKFGGWMLGALDEVSAKASWWAFYTQFQRNPNASVIKNASRTYANAVDYADDMTRRTHAGRGVGELAPAQTSRIINFVAPFQVEINNTYELLKDNVKRKNYLGLLSTGLSVFLFNTVFEAITGSSPLQFDVIRAILDIVLGFKNDDPNDDKDDYGLVDAWRRLSGELVGSLPYAGQLVAALGEDTAKKWFGTDNDATRYGNTQIGVSAVTNAIGGLIDIGQWVATGRKVNWIDDLDDLFNLTMPFGAKQAMRTAEGVRSLVKGYAGKYDEEGKEQVQFIMDRDLITAIHASLFGKWATTNASEYFGEERLLPKLFGAYEGPKSSLGKTVDAKEYKAALETGIDGKDYFTLKYDLKEYPTQGGKRAELMEQSFTPEQKAKLDALMFGSKDAEMKAEGAVVYQKNSDGEWKVKADYTNRDMFELSQNGDKTYTGTLAAMEKTGLPQDQAVLAANMWDQAKEADDSKTEFRNLLRDNDSLTVAQKEALDLQYCGNKYAADYSDPDLYEISITNRSTYEKAKKAKAQGIPVKNYVSLLDKKNEYSGEDKADYMRREIMKGNLTAKQKELLDDLLVSDQGRNPDYSSPAWFEISMLGGGQYQEAKEGSKIGLKPETYLTVYGKWKTLDAKDENGKTVNGLKKKRAKEYLDSLTITAPEYDYIWTVIFGYKK